MGRMIFVTAFALVALPMLIMLVPLFWGFKKHELAEGFTKMMK